MPCAIASIMPLVRQYDDPLVSWAAANPQRCREPGASPLQCPPPPTPSQPLPAEWRAIWSVLALHRGPAAAITAPAIAATANLWPHLSATNRGTKVRHLLELTQDHWPWPICGDPDGYYLAASAHDLSHYCANLRSRALCILRRFASVRRAARRAGYVYHGHSRWSDAVARTENPT
jgi:hypothetical protein